MREGMRITPREPVPASFARGDCFLGVQSMNGDSCWIHRIDGRDGEDENVAGGACLDATG